MTVRAALIGMLLAAAPLVACRRPSAKRAADAGVATSNEPAPVKIVYPAAPGSFVKLLSKVRRAVVHLRGSNPARHGPADWFATAQLAPATPLAPALSARLQRARGSGVIVDAAGHVLTNDHLLGDEETRLFARLYDGREVVAKVVGRDERTDIALLQLDTPAGVKLSPARLGRSAQLQVGEWLLAVADPFGFGPQASAGIVSAVPPRDLPLASHGPWGYVQSDIEIHAGNSGGAVVNSIGELVGIAAAVRPERTGVGFIVPIDTARRILPSLQKHGKVLRSWLGVYIDKVDAAKARAAGLDRARGALVTSVVPGGPAARAGLREGDIIVSFDGKRIGAADELPWLAALSGPGRKIAVVVWRAGKQQRFTVRTVAMPE